MATDLEQKIHDLAKQYGGQKVLDAVLELYKPKEEPKKKGKGAK